MIQSFLCPVGLRRLPAGQLPITCIRLLLQMVAVRAGAVKNAAERDALSTAGQGAGRQALDSTYIRGYMPWVLLP
jgi:hypothetical protein